MNAGPTSERIYAALKRQILDGSFRPGERLDPGRLGDTLGSSVTPVRDGLNMLAGEGLVASRTSDGFSIPLIDEPGLKDMYRWASAVMQLAVRLAGVAQNRSAGLPTSPAPARAAALFVEIGRRTDNAECIRAIAALNDRAGAVRHAEGLVLEGIDEELDAIEAGLAAADAKALIHLLAHYHRRRDRAAGAIVRALYRAPVGRDRA